MRKRRSATHACIASMREWKFSDLETATHQPQIVPRIEGFVFARVFHVGQIRRYPDSSLLTSNRRRSQTRRDLANETDDRFRDQPRSSHDPVIAARRNRAR